MIRMIHMIVFVFAVMVLLQACETQDVSEEDDFGVPEDVTDPAEVEEELASICEEEDGEWREFTNTCVDKCEAARDENSVCGQAMTYGCDCGEGMCWNGRTCVEI
ncbi:MAG: hypothetical protein ACLFNK_03570 [Candidatus Woesearchaeota archaeon]